MPVTIDPAPTPHPEAARLIRDKPALLRDLFDRLAPELRIRAFTIAGVASVALLERIRNKIASIPESHASWEDARADIAAWLRDWMDDAAARRRAELLLRTHLFQAYQAATWRAVQEDPGTLYLQYLATEDDRVRETHRALNGIILPKTDPFWRDHYPPWEWGCRCRVRPVTDTEADIIRRQQAKLPPEDQWIVEGPRAQRLRAGQLDRGGRTYNVAKPAMRPIEDFSWDPGDLRLSLRQIMDRMPPTEASAFRQWARAVKIGSDTLENILDRPAMPWTTARAPEPVEQRAAEAIRSGFQGVQVGRYRELAAALNVAPRMVPDRRALAYGSRAIHIATHAGSWHGTPETIAHELGHAWWSAQLAGRPGLAQQAAAAMRDDWSSFQRVLDRSVPGWRQLPPSGWPDAIAQWLYRQPYASLDMPAQQRVTRVSDAVAAMSRGRWGWGHSVSYWRAPSMDIHEMIAHTSAAYAAGDRFWFAHFSNTVALWRQLTGLP